MIWTIARREVRSLFLSPVAWLLLAIFEFMLAVLLVGHIRIYLRVEPQLLTLPGSPGLTELVSAPTLGNAGVLLLLVMPVLSMRLITDERRQQTLPLLFSAPISMTEIALGKLLGLWLVLMTLAGVAVVLPLTLLVGGTLDFGMFASGVLGLVLLVTLFSAIGLLTSAISPNPVISVVTSFATAFMLWVAAWSANGNGLIDRVLRELAIVDHYEPFLRGSVGTAHIAYFVLMATLFVVLAIRRLDAERLGL